MNLGRRGFFKVLGAIAAGVTLRSVPVLGEQWSKLIPTRVFASAPMPCPAKYGTLNFPDLLVDAPATAASFDPDSMWEQVDAYLSAHNRFMDEAIALISVKTISGPPGADPDLEREIKRALVLPTRWVA